MYIFLAQSSSGLLHLSLTISGSLNTTIILGVLAIFGRGHFDEATKAEALRTMRHVAQDAHKEVDVKLKAHTADIWLRDDGCMPSLWNSSFLGMRTHTLIF